MALLAGNSAAFVRGRPRRRPPRRRAAAAQPATHPGRARLAARGRRRHRLLHDAPQRDTAVALRGEAPPLHLISLDELATEPARPGVHRAGSTGTRRTSRRLVRNRISTSPTSTPSSTPPAPPAGPRARCSPTATTSGAPSPRPSTSACSADDRWLACLPLFHVGGLSILLRSVIYGMPRAIVHEGFDAARVNRAIDDDGVTIVSVVANMLQRMLDARGDRPYPASLRCVLLGGGPAPRAAARGAAPRSRRARRPDLRPDRDRVAGRDAGAGRRAAQARLGRQAAVRHRAAHRRDDGADLRRRTSAGEIVVRGPTVTPGYLNRPEATAARAARRLAAHRRPRATSTREGYLYVLDRRDDLIVSGGENVYPAEVEAVLQSHPAVARSRRLRRRRTSAGASAPVAVVVLRPGAIDQPPRRSSRTAASASPPTRRRPRIDFADALPRNAAGKLLRKDLYRKPLP